MTQHHLLMAVRQRCHNLHVGGVLLRSLHLSMRASTSTSPLLAHTIDSIVLHEHLGATAASIGKLDTVVKHLATTTDNTALLGHFIARRTGHLLLLLLVADHALGLADLIHDLLISAHLRQLVRVLLLLLGIIASLSSVHLVHAASSISRNQLLLVVHLWGHVAIG